LGQNLIGEEGGREKLKKTQRGKGTRPLSKNSQFLHARLENSPPRPTTNSKAQKRGRKSLGKNPESQKAAKKIGPRHCLRSKANGKKANASSFPKAFEEKKEHGLEMTTSEKEGEKTSASDN